MTANNPGASRLLSGPPRLVFAIPLKPRASCSDWATAQAYLRRTIKSAITAAESFPAEVWVACHEQPDLGDLGDAVRVCSVPFPVPLDPIEGGLDKARKRRFIGACLREHVVRDCRASARRDRSVERRHGRLVGACRRHWSGAPRVSGLARCLRAARRL